MKNRVVLIISFVAMFAAIISIGCFLRIPIGVIPIVLQNVLCLLTGAVLGGWLGGAPTALFLLAGLIGLPVYSGGTSGIAVWMGPTGGFLPGYLLGAIVAGLIAGRPSISEKKPDWKSVLRVSLGIIVGMIVLYIPGIIRFAFWATGAGKVPVEQSVLAYTMGACVIPYIPGDLLKMALAIPIALVLRPILAQYIYPSQIKK